ncbi:MAG: DNA repair protein RadC [Betaproteobacteria bacterium]|nr:DNA repair protein RadC [Betaproteobacteria bacterium]
MAITDWPADERPREKLLALGAQVLTDAELLAIFLRVGIKGQSAVDLARTLLGHFGTLNHLCNACADEFASIPGMGLAKYAQLQAVMELARRALAERLTEGALFDSPTEVRDWLQLRMAHLPHETFCILLLDACHRLIEAVDLFRGTLNQTSVYPREVVKLALRYNAAAVVLAHNHPSGVREPSHSDELITRDLRDALALIDVKVLDHFVVPAHGKPLSFAERGLL